MLYIYVKTFPLPLEAAPEDPFFVKLFYNSLCLFPGYDVSQRLKEIKHKGKPTVSLSPLCFFEDLLSSPG